MPVAQSSSSENSVGAGSPRSVSVSSRLRRVAASRRTYSPARSARDRGRRAPAPGPASSPRTRAARRRRRWRASGPRSRSRRGRAAPSCCSSCCAPARRRNATSGSARDGVAAASRPAAIGDEHFGRPMRRSSSSSACGAISRRAASPLARDEPGEPDRALVVVTAPAGRCRALSSSSSASVSVPGVTMRVTWRSTGPLAVAGSPICSQIATDSPSFTSLARYCSTECTGTPAILIGAPAEAPREVSVMSSSRAPFSASS